MPALSSEDLRWRVIWFVHVLQHSVTEASFLLGVSERTVEHYISKLLVTGDVKSETIGRSHEETRNVFQLQKAWVSFVFGVKNPQTNVHSGRIHFPVRWTQLMKFWISNSVTTVLFGRATSVRHSLFAIRSNNLFWNRCIHPSLIYFSNQLPYNKISSQSE